MVYKKIKKYLDTIDWCQSTNRGVCLKLIQPKFVFVCAEVLRPSKTIGVRLVVVS